MEISCPDQVGGLLVPDGRQGGAAPSTLGAQTYAIMRAQLMGGAFSPGEKLSLRSLARRFGVSVQPVRVAVARLIADDALEVTPNRAVRVPLMSVARFEELTTIRLAIEGFAIERAATRHSAAELAQMRRHDRAFRQQCRRRVPDPDAAVQANHDLHFTAYRAAGLPTLMPIIEGLWLRIGPVLNLDMRSSAQRLQMGQAESCHAALVAALQARSAAQARRALQADIRSAADFILERGILLRD